MTEPQETEPREQLRRLVEVLDRQMPDDEEARIVVEATGVDVPALAARLRAHAAAPAPEAKKVVVLRRVAVITAWAAAAAILVAGIAAAVTIAQKPPDVPQSTQAPKSRARELPRLRPDPQPAPR